MQDPRHDLMEQAKDIAGGAYDDLRNGVNPDQSFKRWLEAVSIYRGLRRDRDRDTQNIRAKAKNNLKERVGA